MWTVIGIIFMAGAYRLGVALTERKEKQREQAYRRHAACLKDLIDEITCDRDGDKWLRGVIKTVTAGYAKAPLTDSEWRNLDAQFMSVLRLAEKQRELRASSLAFSAIVGQGR